MADNSQPLYVRYGDRFYKAGSLIALPPDYKPSRQTDGRLSYTWRLVYVHYNAEFDCLALEPVTHTVAKAAWPEEYERAMGHIY